MLEGSPPDPAPASEAPEAPPASPAEGQAEQPQEARTSEEVEAIWRNRVAGKDRAHAAETATLRSQIDSLTRERESLRATQTQQTTSAESDANAWKERAEAAERERDAERQTRLLEVRSVKYAAAAEALDEPTLAAMDEAKLAALNARLTGDEAPPPPVIDPSRAPRTAPSPPVPPNERSVEDLERELKQNEPAFVEGLRNPYG